MIEVVARQGVEPPMPAGRSKITGVADEAWQALIAVCHERGVTFLRGLEESDQKTPSR